SVVAASSRAWMAELSPARFLTRSWRSSWKGKESANAEEKLKANLSAVVVTGPSPVFVFWALSGGASAAFHGIPAMLIASMIVLAVVTPGLILMVRTFCE